MLYRLTAWVGKGRIYFFLQVCVDIADYLELMIVSCDENEDENILLAKLEKLIEFLKWLNSLLPKEAQEC